MVQPVIPSSKEKLKDHFSLSGRQAIRIGALWKSGIGCSEGILETFGNNKSLTSLLMSEKILNLSSPIEAPLKNLIEDQELEVDLTMTEEHDVTVLCLKEETMADDVFEEHEEAEPEQSRASAEDSVSLAFSDEDNQNLPIFDELEQGNLMEEDELQELQMTLLTGVDPEEKIEALRQLSLASISKEEKSAFILKALSDEALRVRTEAVQILKTLGIPQELTEAMKTFLEGDQSQKAYAAEKIKSMKEDLNSFEKMTVLGLFITELEKEANPDILGIIIGILQHYVDVVANHLDKFLSRITRSLLQQLVSHFDRIAPDVKAFYKQLGQRIPSEVAELLREEVEIVDERHLKAYLLILLGHIELPFSRQKEVAREMIRLIGDWSDTEVACRRLGNSFIQQGEASFQAVMEEFSDIPSRQREYILRLMSELMLNTDLSEQTKERFGEFLVHLSTIEKRDIRETLLEQKFLFQSWIAPERKQTIAKNLLETTSRFRGERIEDLTKLALKKLGLSVAPIIFTFVKRPTYTFHQEMGLQVLGDLFSEADPELLSANMREEIQDVYDELVSFLEREKNLEEEVQQMRMDVLSRILSGPFASRKKVRKKLTKWKEQVEDADQPFESLRGLDWLVASQKIDAELVQDVGNLFLQYLQSDLPSIISQEQNLDDEPGRQLLVGRKTEAYTDIIPTVIDGLMRICRREDLDETFRRRIIDALLNKWEEIVGFDAVWGPASVTKLARNLGKIACSPYVDTSEKEKIIRALSQKIKNLSIVRILGKILGEGFESAKIRRMSTKISKAILEMLEMDDYSDPEEQRKLLEALGKICTRRNIAGDRQTNNRLREQMIDALFNGLHENMDGMVPLLQDLAEEERIPDEHRSKIQDKLSRFVE